MIPPALTAVEGIVATLAEGTITTGQALAQLRARGHNPDAMALADAVQSFTDRDGLAGGLIDPLDYLETAPTVGVDWQQHAINKVEADLEFALRQLAKRPAQAGVVA